MDFTVAAVGFVVGLGTVAFAIPRAIEFLEGWRRKSLRRALSSSDPKIRADAMAWMDGRRSVNEIEFARGLLRCGDSRVVLDIAPYFLREGVSRVDDALEALAQVAAKGDEEQRQDAVLRLVVAPRLSQSVVDLMIGLLSVEPVRQIRRDVVLVLVRMAEPNSCEYLDSVTRAKIVGAVARSLEDQAAEVRDCATSCLQPGGQLADLIHEAELVLIQLLRSPRQEVVDRSAQLILAHRHRLRAATSCALISRARPDILNSVL